MNKHVSIEWFEGPRARLLRALRWFDWVSFGDLLVAIDASADSETAEYVCLARMIHRLVREGLVESREVKRHFRQYRLKRRPPRSVGVEEFA